MIRFSTRAAGLVLRVGGACLAALVMIAPRSAADVPSSHGAVAARPAFAAHVALQSRTRDPIKKKKRSSRIRATSARAPRRPSGPAWTAPRGAEALAQAVGSALASHTRRGEWGAIIVSLTRGDTLFAQNADAMMQPASTMKMYTSAVALDRFGPDYTFRTPVLRDGQVGPDGTLNGSLYLRGVGDPSLSSRFWHDESPMDVLARQIAAAGIKRVHGDMVGDATAFDDKLVPDGWKSSYLGAAYAARVSALSLNENVVWVVVQPNGRSAAVTLEPATTTIPVESTVRLVGGSGGSISASRRSDGTIAVRGSIGANSIPRKYSLVVDNPPMFAAGALRAALQKAGVTVDGQTRLAATPPGATEVAAVASPPLAQIIGEMDRESINVVAELLFRAAAHAATNQVGSAETGLANLRTFLTKKVGAPANVVDVSDGSGLSTLDRVTPRSMVELLGFAHHADWGPVFHAALPVDGESGTLKRRAKGTPARGNLHAKTGTTNTVAALGGYVTAKDGEVLAFSLVYNGTDRGNAKAAMDQIGATMAEFVRD
ncbi:MAG TPA: D-alanyl-D-alanine carboxypeptidase/D-alanyl-D-alanine-endopeptidase [Gemmatimonadaceae bacterium]|jgi:serine-type D-Ala-D-Ala carboxypeptidase/endopeptidase (penicillin-binding protein 4)|nr:D-alanyl-D-alanine carboxypeptidase/D-alanyl-D-alanine-endopeptidase [Gemmatimonadaceae bacterium]